MATFMSIVKYEVDESSGAVKFLGGFTKPYGATKKSPKSTSKRMVFEELDDEVVEL